MKIALLSRWLWEEHQRAGEAGGTVEQLANAIREQGHEVIALSQDPNQKEPLKESKIGNLECWLTPRYRRDGLSYFPDKVGKLLMGHRKLRSDSLALHQFLRNKGPFDLLWAQCEEPDGLLAAWAKKLAPLPPIATQIFALRYEFLSSQSEPRFRQRRILNYALKRADLVIANSLLTAEALQEHYKIDETKIVTLSHNLTHEFLQQASKISENESKEERILFLGALNEKKGALLFLEAAQAIAERRPKSKFIMVGDFTEKNKGFEQRWKQQLAKTHLGAHLEMLGHLKSDEVLKQIQQSSLVVLPSLFDEFSRALVEVLALGKPVVSTHTVGASYLLERDRSGLIVAPGDVEELTRAILAILDDPSFTTQSSKNAPLIREEFAPETIARQLIQIWQTRI